MNHIQIDESESARDRDIRIEEEKIEIDFLPYEISQTIKRQMFWLSWISGKLIGGDRSKKLLDIGSNLFWLTGIAAQYQVQMVDVRSHPLAKHFPFQMSIGDAASLPFEDSSFDVITFPQLLHWLGTAAYGGEVSLNADEKTLSEISRVMKPSGFGLFITFVVPGQGIFKIKGRRLYSVADLKHVVEQAGLEISEMEFFNPNLEAIQAHDLTAPTGLELVPGNPDEDICWAFLKVNKS